jgi:hypothetical protein
MTTNTYNKSETFSKCISFVILHTSPALIFIYSRYKLIATKLITLQISHCKIIKLSLCLIKHHAMKMYEEMKVYLFAFLTSALDGGVWKASHPSHFTPGGKSPWYPLDRRLGGLQNWSGHGGKE